MYVFGPRYGNNRIISITNSKWLAYAELHRSHSLWSAVERFARPGQGLVEPCRPNFGSAPLTLDLTILTDGVGFTGKGLL